MLIAALFFLSGVLRVAKIDLEAVTVPKVSVEVVSAPVSLLIESVIQMFVEIAGSGWMSPYVWFSLHFRITESRQLIIPSSEYKATF